MSEQNQKVIGECLRAAPIFLEGDLAIVTGVDEAQFQEITDSYPDVDNNEEVVYLAIHGALGNLLGYPHGMLRKWDEFISVTPDELTLLFARWKTLKFSGSA